MSDHISGPRALADPIADITDVYAFPSPERPGWLSLVMNTLPFAQPTQPLSEGLIYRFRLRPLEATNDETRTPFRPLDDEVRFDVVFDEHGDVQEGVCSGPDAAQVQFVVGDEAGGEHDGIRAFAGPRWDPFFFDARAALETVATEKLAFTDHGSIFMDGKNVLTLVVEIDCARFLGGNTLVGVIAETLTRGKFNVRIERVGRPEVKNMLLAPTQFDQVNRDIDIRDLYNMEDGFHLAESYKPAYLARLNANLAFWDGLDGKTDWPTNGNGDHPLTSLWLADYLIVDVSRPYSEQGSFLEPERAAREQREHATCGGRALNDDVMDTFFTFIVTGGNGAPVRDGIDASSKPGTQTFPYLQPAEPGPARAAGAPLMAAASEVQLELEHIQSGALHERPSPYVGRYLLLRIDDRAAGRELVRRLHPVVDASRDPSAARDAWATVAFTYTGLERARRAAGVARQLRPGVPAGHGGARGRDRRRRRRATPPTGRRRSVRRTCTLRSASSRRAANGSKPSPERARQRTRGAAAASR